MAYRCALCGKGKIFGHHTSHKPGVAGGQWKKKAPKTRHISFPNLHVYRGVLNGVKGKWLLCTKCLRRIKKQARLDKTTGQARTEKKTDKKPPSGATAVSV